MNIQFLGHAGLGVGTREGTVLFDPWFGGAFQAAWWPYPSNQLLLPSLGEAGVRAIVLSHAHDDHANVESLKMVPGVPVVIPTYPSSRLREKVMGAGSRKVVELRPWKEYTIDGMTVFFVPESSAAHDSAIVVRLGSCVLLNMNDARLSMRQLQSIKARVGEIDVLALQISGASWHPMCYPQYSAEEAEAISLRKRATKFGFVADAIKVVSAKTVIPFAGPPCFLDPDLFDFNWDKMFPTQEEAAVWLGKQGASGVEVMLPGDKWDVLSRTKQAHPFWGDFSLSGDRRWYLEEYARDCQTRMKEVLGRYPRPNQNVRDSFQKYLEKLSGMSPYFSGKIGMRVGFELEDTGEAWAVDFCAGGISKALKDCGYWLRFDSKWLGAILTERIGWDDLLLSLRIQLGRDPDAYNEHLIHLLMCAGDRASLQAIESLEKKLASSARETMCVQTNGVWYRVPAQCPHRGHALGPHMVEGGMLTCPGHGYRFDLKRDGRCVNTPSCAALQVAEVQEAGEEI
mgnify:CR=1 FL=1